MLAAASFYVIGNILGVTIDFRTLVPQQHVGIVIVALCVVIWLAILRLWRVRDNRRSTVSAKHDGSAALAEW